MTAHPAAPDWELWGVFSVADHLRRRSFVADVLIYDRLIVPVPAEREGELWRKWERRWDPARQAELLGVIEAELPGLVRRVPCPRTTTGSGGATPSATVCASVWPTRPRGTSTSSKRLIERPTPTASASSPNATTWSTSSTAKRTRA